MNTNLQFLNEKFTIPGSLSFDQNDQGLVFASVATSACRARIYLQGAHLSHWQPEGSEAVLFLSDRSAFAPGKAIRGGIPLIFPWFGGRQANPYSERTDGPSHGFARTSVWQLQSVSRETEDLELTFTLGADDNSRALGWDNFLATYTVRLGRELHLQLTVQNNSPSTIQFEEALHTYLAVADATRARIEGLGGCEYLDKTDGMRRKKQEPATIELTGQTDRPYLNTTARVDLVDPVGLRRIVVDKDCSQTTVVWNPWSELTAKMSDMSPDGWRAMTCIETANALENAVTLAAGESHTMRAGISVQKLAATPQ
ncbi:MAG: D-hexose-6-phosphate mutarotase [Cyanobacteria bacterium SZAS LIN-2]|nr:D-hexose-6-phosphate mutarotase [Cyanobacteria bacterium SZAS LIN-2]